MAEKEEKSRRQICLRLFFVPLLWQEQVAAGPALGLVEVVEVIDSDFLTGLSIAAVDYYPFHVLHRTHLFLHRAQMFRTNRGRKTAHRGYRQW